MLYIVGTPIGNLEDITLRAAKTLASSDIILAEDTRSAQTLLNFIQKTFNLPLNSSQKMISYYKEKEFEKLPEVLDLLKEGSSISLISESGMPLVSDPGYLLVKEVVKQNISFTVTPGPTAVTTALVLSGFNPENFMFLGYLPKGKNQLIRSFERLNNIEKIDPKIVFIAYESPHRVKETLRIMNEVVPAAEIALCRELTKKFEEVRRGTPAQLLAHDYKGEITLVVKL